jgi:RimJ/RimL family protein N-acetyltransferase
VLNRPRVISLIDPQNISSAAVARRLGEKPVSKWMYDAQELDIYAIQREEWQAMEAKGGPG